jgi:hypothetical protein
MDKPKFWYPKTQAEVIAKYQALEILDENLEPLTSSPFLPIRKEDQPRPCSDCGRDILWVSRWHGRPATPLNASFKPGDRMGWLETAPGHFLPANHHKCPGKSDDELRKEHEKKRHALGLDLIRRPKKPKPIQGNLF